MFTQFNNHIHQLLRTARQARTSLALGISHEATQVHAVQLRADPHERLSLQHHAHVSHLPLTPTQWGLTGASLSALLPQLPTPTPDIIMALPNHVASHQYVALDPSGPAYDAQIHALLQQETSADNLVTDYLCLDDDGPDSSPIGLLCFTHQDAVRHYQQVTQAQQLRLCCLDIEAFAALNAWYFWLKQCAPERLDQVLALWHLKPTDVSLYVCQRQRLLLQAHLSLANEADARSPQDQSARFVQQTWQRFHATHAETISHVFVTGRHSDDPAFTNILHAVDTLFTVAHPITALSTSAAFSQATLDEHAPDLLIAFGLALRSLDDPH